jgi:hypothetical protein
VKTEAVQVSKILNLAIITGKVSRGFSPVVGDFFVRINSKQGDAATETPLQVAFGLLEGAPILRLKVL